MGKVYLFEHPLIQHKLSILRDKNTTVRDFRELVKEISMLMTYEVTRDLPLEEVQIETPVCRTVVSQLKGMDIGIVPVLRAGLGMVEGMLALIPNAKVGHIGIFRDPESKAPVEYYCKLPEDIDKRRMIIVDPMLATGGSSCAAINFLKEKGARSIALMNLIAAPEGVALVQKTHPDVDIFIAALDERLDEDAFIVPGLGDAGDRIFGTI